MTVSKEITFSGQDINPLLGHVLSLPREENGAVQWREKDKIAGVEIGGYSSIHLKPGENAECTVTLLHNRGGFEDADPVCPRCVEDGRIHITLKGVMDDNANWTR